MNTRNYEYVVLMMTSDDQSLSADLKIFTRFDIDYCADFKFENLFKVFFYRFSKSRNLTLFMRKLKSSCDVITMTQFFVPCVYGNPSRKCSSCVAGGTGRASIVNTHYTKGISLHGSPSDEKDRKRRHQRNRLVIKALTEFRAIYAYVLTCSTNFEKTKKV